jgi:hypothetical protein
MKALDRLRNKTAAQQGFGTENPSFGTAPLGASPDSREPPRPRARRRVEEEEKSTNSLIFHNSDDSEPGSKISIQAKNGGDISAKTPAAPAPAVASLSRGRMGCATGSVRRCICPARRLIRASRKISAISTSLNRPPSTTPPSRRRIATSGAWHRNGAPPSGSAHRPTSASMAWPRTARRVAELTGGAVPSSRARGTAGPASRPMRDVTIS